MPFLNETLHPKAVSLRNHIAAAYYKEAADDAQFYTPLMLWQTAQGMTDDKTADLYTRIEETFSDAPFPEHDTDTQVGWLSRCLWANDKAVAA